MQQLTERARQFIPGSAADEWESLRQVAPTWADQMAETARRCGSDLLDGTVELLGHPVQLGGSFDWHLDPKSAYRFPRVFYADVQLYELPGDVDVKYVWEVNRHQWLVHLAMAWRLDQDDRSAGLARAAMLDWIEQNPYREGVNWTSGLEVAMRAVSWLWTLAICGNASCWHADDGPRIGQSLAEHGQFLQGHLSLYSSPYNHLVGEATALFLLGHWLAGFPDADTWRNLGRSILETHGPRQFYSDGFSVEQATGYHFFTLGFLLQAAIVARQVGEPLRHVEQVLPTSLSAGAALRQPDGRWPMLGDLDSARSLPVPADDFWDFRSLCSLGAVLFNDGSLKLAAEEPGQEIFWLLGSQGIRRWQELPSEPDSRTTILPDAGYVSASSQDKQDWLLFDAGPLADGLHPDAVPSVAHGHADTLGVWLFWQGRPVLVDRGIFRYAGPRAEGDYFRSPAAHSTFEVIGSPVARPAGRLAWSHVCPRPELAARVGENLWLARGRIRLPHNLMAERFVLGIPGEGFWIADQVLGAKTGTANWYWQLPSELEPQLAADNDGKVCVLIPGGTIAIQSNADGAAARIDVAGEGTVAWQATGYGTRLPGRRLALTVPVRPGLIVITSIGKPGRSASVLTANGSAGSHMETLQSAARPWPQVPEILWHVETSRGWRLIAAGVPGHAPPAGWSPIPGQGDWPACESPVEP